MLAAGLMMHRRDIPAEFRTKAEAAASGEWVERGGGAIIAPDTRYLVEPLYDREELIVADLDLNEIDEAVMTLDVSGHYSRPDVFIFETRSTTK